MKKAPKFERVEVSSASGKAFTLILEVINENPTMLTGTVCERDGAAEWTKGGTMATVRIIKKAAITKRTPLRVNDGCLEEAS